MLAAVADTHAVLWFLFGDARLSVAAKQAIDDASRNGDRIGLSAITLIETIYLSEKGKVSAEAPNRLIDIIADPAGVFVDLPVDIRISKMVESVARNVVPDMPDRIIAATALRYVCR
jgi:PIN domain nuclease of toxin-antitoxin system